MLREFLYVDVARVRSLLAQLDDGVLEHVVRRQGSSATNDLLALIGLKGIHQSNTSTVAEESRSVQDLLFTVFEEAVQSEGILRDLSHDDVSLADDWETSAVHERLDEGEIVRFSTRILVVDPHFVQGRFERYVALNDALAEMALLQLEPNLELLRTTLQVHMEDGGSSAGAVAADRSAGFRPGHRGGVSQHTDLEPADGRPGHSVSSARPSNRACGFPAHGSPTSFTAGIRSPPPVPPGPGGDDDPVEVDQAELVGRLEGDNRPAERPAAVMAFSDHQG